MIEGLKPYPEYKDSGLPWLEMVPENWDIRRLRHTVEMMVSNIDKHTKKGEQPVRLCNYVDVYKNEKITERLQFMWATASKDEIARFTLRLDDVVITKDSEIWTDIGVPALVEYAAPDFVCGYHLAILRPRRGMLMGAFLLRALQSQGVAAQFHVGANGVTRFGLSHADIKNILIPLPALDEQAAIVRFLDHANGKIERAIRAKKKLIALLNEQKQAIIHRAVTRGLDPDVKLKPSGIPWLGDVPEHWAVRRNAYLFDERIERGRLGLPILVVSLRTGVTEGSTHDEDGREKRLIADVTKYKFADKDDIAYNMMRMWQGAVGVVPMAGMVSPAYVVAKPRPGVLSAYYDHLFHTEDCKNEINRHSRGIVTDRNRLYWDQFKKLSFPLPSFTEQQQIVSWIDRETAALNAAISGTEREIALLREYRTTLTADVVTGKLDVRDTMK